MQLLALALPALLLIIAASGFVPVLSGLQRCVVLATAAIQGAATVAPSSVSRLIGQVQGDLINIRLFGTGSAAGNFWGWLQTGDVVLLLYLLAELLPHLALFFFLVMLARRPAVAADAGVPTPPAVKQAARRAIWAGGVLVAFGFGWRVYMAFHSAPWPRGMAHPGNLALAVRILRQASGAIPYLVIPWVVYSGFPPENARPGTPVR
jgi:hypothetical protein